MSPSGSQTDDALPETTGSGDASCARHNRQTPNGFEQRLLARARRAGFVRGDRLVVAFSGGRDSLALAAALRRVQRVIGVEPILVHVDHRLRETSSDDAVKAERLATALELEFLSSAVPELPMAKHPGVGIEEAARRERYRILFAKADELGAREVATAHHQSDQAETVLMHLLRGGGVHGAVAMGERTPAPLSDISRENVAPWLWRPLLQESRAEIDAYVKGIGLIPLEDPSNRDQTLRRNALRHQILPKLEEHFPGATAALARYATLAAEDDRVLDELAVRVLAETVDPGGRLDAARLGEKPIALQRRIARHWLLMTTGSAAFTAERTEAILNLAGQARGGRVEIGEGWTVHRVRGMLQLERA